MMRSAASLRTPWSQSLIGGTIRPSSNTEVRVRGHRAGHGSADVVVVAEGLHEGDHLRAVAPSTNTGTVTHRSGRCPMPPSDR